MDRLNANRNKFPHVIFSFIFAIWIFINLKVAVLKIFNNILSMQLLCIHMPVMDLGDYGGQ